MSIRGTCWSVTWYPPTDSMNYEVSKAEIEAYSKRQLAPGWKLQGQMEQCPDTKRYHFQAMLKTPQVRCSAVINAMDKAHIELAKNKSALASYVTKEESRVATIESTQAIPTLFEYQGMIAEKYVEEECKAFIAKRMELTEWKEQYGEAFVKYIDSLVAKDIKSGRRGAEYIAVNPMWRSAWKLFGPEIISRSNIQYGEQAQESDGTQGESASQEDSERQSVLWETD